jgi:hypothetical protein
MAKHPYSFQLRYEWSREQGGIKYEILNPDYEFDWDPVEPDEHATPPLTARLKTRILHTSRALLSQHKRNENLNVLDYLRCVGCGGTTISRGQDEMRCDDCGQVYPLREAGIPDFTAG